VTGWTFKARWPLDPDVARDKAGFRRLQVLACREIDRIADRTGCRIVGEIVWDLAGDELVAKAPAVPTRQETAA
jgi:hypothetical protein